MTDIIAKATQMLRQAGLDPGALSVRELSGGANNRVYRLRCASGDFALKHYFSHPGDRRDRLSAEWGMLSYLAKLGEHVVPRCIGFDARDQLGLYGWIEGQRPDIASVNLVQAAAQFFARMNKGRDSAQELPVASAASFCITEAMEEIERRLAALMQVSRALDLDRAAAVLVDEMGKAWRGLKENTLAQSASLGIDPDQPIEMAQRCLSPSDFGLHNMLCSRSGQVYFVDFEYAGWDDPARMIADFFCQPAIPVSLRHWDTFTQTALADFPAQDGIVARAQILLPAIQLRWCAIALNTFLPISSERRRFSFAGADATRTKVQQLRVAQSLFSRMAA